MSAFRKLLAEAGGPAAPAAQRARLRDLLAGELRQSEAELWRPRSGYRTPVLVAFAASRRRLRCSCPADGRLAADAERASERGWRVVAAAVGALVGVAALPPPERAEALCLEVGEADGLLEISCPLKRPEAPDDAELCALSFEVALEDADRLRVAGVPVPSGLLGEVGEWRAPIGATHPLRVAEAVARLGGDPADQASLESLADSVLALLEPPASLARAHDDPDPVRRIVRRIVQRLDGLGKWGGYHTEFRHLAKGFVGNDAETALRGAERLLAAGLLCEKRSVGQRHVWLNPRRSGEIRRLIEAGDLPEGLQLPK